MVQSDSQLAPEGTIADIEARLLLWTKRHSSGLARVEFSSEFARQRVVDQLRQSLKELEIPFYEINLPLWEKPDTVVASLLQQLQTFNNGVVSISGFATAFSVEMSLVDALRLLNFNREQLAEPPLRQVWWMTYTFTNAAIHAMPDLNSWFSLKLLLQEDLALDSQLQIPLFGDGTSVNIDDARRRAKDLMGRFERAKASGKPTHQLLQTYVLPAIKALASAGAVQDAHAIAIRSEFFTKNTNSLNIADGLSNLAALYLFQGQYSEAEPLFMEALQIRKQLYGNNHTNVAESLNNLAYLYQSQGRYSDAEPLYLEALRIRMKLNDHLNVANSLNNLAYLYQSQGRYSKAEPLHLEALTIRERLLGHEHPDVYTSLNNLAALYKSQGRYNEAEPLHLEVLQMRQQLLGNDHPDVATSLNNLAELYKSQGRYDEAEPLYKSSLEINKNLLGNDHPNVANNLNNLARLYELQGCPADAESYYVMALDIMAQQLGDEHPSTVVVRNNLDNLRRHQVRFATQNHAR